MKKLLLCILCIVTCLCAIGFVGCGDNSTPPETPQTQSDKTITGVTYESATFTYDGTEKVLTVSGTVPEGVTVAYTNNKGTNAGTYNAQAVLSGTGYKTLTVSATLTINKAELTGISVNAEQSIKHDGNYHFPEYTGNLPNGVSVKYVIDGTENNNGVRAIGTYQISVIFYGNNYNEKSFDCEYKIKVNFTGLATTVINSLGSCPDPWSFLPSTFAAQNKAITTAPTYSNFYAVSSIPLNGIGKQLSVVYGVLNKTSKALSFVQPIFTAMNSIKSLYTTFLDNEPENYDSYTATTSGITFTITLLGSQYQLSATVKNIAVVLFADTENSSYGGKIQLTATTALKYTVTDSMLLVALNILDTSATQLSFVRDGNTVTGTFYEYLIAGDKQITATSAMIEVNETYTTLIGTKGDFVPTLIGRNCEVYRNSDGLLVGTEVRESKTVLGQDITFNTLWYNLSAVTGIENIKKVDEQNGSNSDTIYINNSAESIHSKNVSLINASRRFDIEFKTMYFYTYNQTNEEYEKISCEIPMMFIQEEYFDDFEADFKDENRSCLPASGVTLNVSSSDKAAVYYGYYTLLQTYDLIKDAVTFQMITDYCKA